MRAIITGDKGFVGQHLTTLLEKEGIEVTGYDLVDGFDVRNERDVLRAFSIRPDYIFHLAALTNVPESFIEPANYIETNVIGSLNILKAAFELGLSSNILLASSTEVYRPALDDTPLDINAPTQPRTPYGVSKLAMEQLAAIYATLHKLHVVITRTNNHTGPGQDGPFAVTSFAKQIVAIERGEQDELKHGNLGNYRSYLDVRDVVKAYRIAIDLEPYIYNIASDESIQVQELLDRLVAQAKVPVKTSVETSLMRPAERDRTFYKSSAKLREAGWEQEYTLNRTLHDVLDYWRSK